MDMRVPYVFPTGGTSIPPRAKDKDVQPYFFSPTFQCYTSPPFYRSLLMELECVAAHIDKCRSKDRELIWKQLFTLVGAKPVLCSKHLSPILRTWTGAPTINLLAIELLYLAFATAFDKNPELVTASPLPASRITAYNNSRHEEPNPGPGSASSPITIEASPGEIYSPSTFAQKSAEKVRAPSPLGAHAAPRVPPQGPPPVPYQQSHHSIASTNPHMTESPRMLSTSNGTSSGKEPTSSPSHVNQTPITPVASNSKKSEEPDFLQQLIDLQTWKTALDQQPDNVKQKIWRVWEGLLDCDVPPNLDRHSFSSNINHWAQNIATCVPLVKNLHSVILFLKNSVESLKTLDNSTNLQQVSSQPPAKENSPATNPLNHPQKRNSLNEFSHSPGKEGGSNRANAAEPSGGGLRSSFGAESMNDGMHQLFPILPLPTPLGYNSAGFPVGFSNPRGQVQFTSGTQFHSFPVPLLPHPGQPKSGFSQSPGPEMGRISSFKRKPSGPSGGSATHPDPKRMKPGNDF